MNVMTAGMMGVDFVARCIASRAKAESKIKLPYAPIADLKYKQHIIRASNPVSMEFDPLIQSFKCDLAYYHTGTGIGFNTPQRIYSKANIYPSIGAFVHGGGYSIWLAISDSPLGATVYNSYSVTPLEPAKTVDYMGTTWYVSKSDYASSDGICTGLSADYPTQVTFSGDSVSDDDVKAILDYVHAEVISHEQLLL